MIDIAIGDIHLGWGRSSFMQRASAPLAFRSRIDRWDEITRKVKTMIEEGTIPHIRILGDLFHSGFLTSLTVYETLELAKIRYLASLCPVTILGGHHDKVSSKEQVSILKDLIGVELITDHLVERYPGVNIICLGTQRERLLDTLKMIKDGGLLTEPKLIIYLHEDFSEWFQLKGIGPRGFSLHDVFGLFRDREVRIFDGHYHTGAELGKFKAIQSFSPISFSEAHSIRSAELPETIDRCFSWSGVLTIKIEEDGSISDTKDWITDKLPIFLKTYVSSDNGKALLTKLLEKIKSRQAPTFIEFISKSSDPGMKEFASTIEEIKKVVEGWRMRILDREEERVSHIIDFEALTPSVLFDFLEKTFTERIKDKDSLNLVRKELEIWRKTYGG